MDHEPPVAGSRRRWFQFRLRTLLIFVTLLSIPFAWIGWELQQRRAERPSIDWVTSSGGRIGRQSLGGAVIASRSISGEIDHPRSSKSWEDWTDTPFGKRVRTVEFNDVHDELRDLTPLMRFQKLQRLIICKVNVADLTALSDLQSMSLLILRNSQVQDLSALAGLENLRGLFLQHTRGHDLAFLARLENLEFLELRGVEAGDLSPLAGLKKLKFLSLHEIEVEELTPLHELKQLQKIGFHDVSVDSIKLGSGEEEHEQIEALRKALPDCELHGIE